MKDTQSLFIPNNKISLRFVSPLELMKLLLLLLL